MTQCLPPSHDIVAHHWERCGEVSCGTSMLYSVLLIFPLPMLLVFPHLRVEVGVHAVLSYCSDYTAASAFESSTKFHTSKI